ncbi:MAG: hypothetical protein ABWX88_01765 [Pseudoxanthomonas sp.]
MNRSLLQTALAAALLLVSASSNAGPVPAEGQTASPGALVFDCNALALPSQREVAALTRQANFSQVYATRARLMAEVNRACQRKGAARVQVLPPSRLDERRLASRNPAR